MKIIARPRALKDMNYPELETFIDVQIRCSSDFEGRLTPTRSEGNGGSVAYSTTANWSFGRLVNYEPAFGIDHPMVVEKMALET